MQKCFYCKKETEWKTEERIFSNGIVHIQGTCLDCGNKRILPKERSYEECILYFGKHKGKNITEIPTDYLVWSLEENLISGGTARKTIQYLKQKGIEVNK
ncbi:MAG: hypothetical protein AABY22_10705 [Nanoarchaeota archaeon]